MLPKAVVGVVASSRSASRPMFFLELCQSLARRSESVSKYHVKDFTLVLLYWYHRCWRCDQPPLKAPQGCMGAICAEQGCQEGCSGWSQEVWAVQLRNGECWTSVHWHALQCWVIDFSQPGICSSIFGCRLMITPSFFLMCPSLPPTGIMMTKELWLRTRA